MVPERNATGTNTATSTSDVAMTAPATSPIARRAAPGASPCMSPRLRAMFSTTTIASSTTSPVASTIPNRVSVLIENPNALMNMKVPTSDTGMVIAGITVARQSWRNRKITRITRMIASSRVFSTSRIDSRTAVVGLKAIVYFIDGGNDADSRVSVARTADSRSNAFAPGNWKTPMPTASRPSKRRFKE